LFHSLTAIVYLPGIGRLRLKVAPLPSILFSAHIFPPWDSMKFLEINNPKPVPPESVETNLENSFGIVIGDDPVPVSLILI
jgi:hypothetical protein